MFTWQFFHFLSELVAKKRTSFSSKVSKVHHHSDYTLSSLDTNYKSSSPTTSSRWCYIIDRDDFCVFIFLRSCYMNMYSRSILPMWLVRLREFIWLSPIITFCDSVIDSLVILYICILFSEARP